MVKISLSTVIEDIIHLGEDNPEIERQLTPQTILHQEGDFEKLEIIYSVANYYGIDIPDEDYQKIRSVKELAVYMQNRLQFQQRQSSLSS